MTVDVLVVGAGAMGRWVARTLGADGELDAAIAVADADPAVAAAAAAELDVRVAPLSPADNHDAGTDGDGDVDAGADADPGSGADGPDGDADARVDAADPDPVPVPDPPGGYDLVCVAVPLPAAPATIAAQAPRGRAVCDVTGVMEPAVAAMRAADVGQRLSLHPLFAPARAPGRVAAVPDAPGETTGRVRAALHRAGNDVFETTPAVHDRAMATVQARTHAAVLAFALAAEPVPREFETPVYRELRRAATTMLDGDPRVYADVQSAFDGAGDVADAARRVADAVAADRDADHPDDDHGDDGNGADHGDGNGDDGAFADLYRSAARRFGADAGDHDAADDATDGHDGAGDRR